MADDFGSTTSAGNLGTITVGGSATGTIEVAQDRDWFKITLVAGQSYIFNMDRGTLPDPFLILRDRNGIDVVSNDDINGAANRNSQIRFTATVSGTYYLEAFTNDGSANAIGTYTVRAAIDPSPPVVVDDYGAQAGSPTVGSIAVGGTVTGNLETINDRDWFAITLTAGGSYTFRETKGTLADPLLRLRDGNGVLIAGDDDSGGSLNSLINYTAPTTGTYYLEANTADAGQAAGIGTYTISAVVNGNPPPAPTDDYGSQVGAGNLGSVTVGGTSTGLINYGGDHDWFAVTLSAGSIYRIRDEIGTLADPRFSLRNSIGLAIVGDDDSGGGFNAQLDYTAPTSGTYYIDANTSDGTATGNYTVRVTLLYGAPVVVNKTGSTALEGGTDPITSTELSTTDPDTAATAIIYRLTGAPTNGALTRSGSAIALNGTFTQADVNSGLIAYVHNGSETTTDTLTFSITDGTTTFTGQTFGITVTPVNDAPVLGGAGNNRAYTENGVGVAASNAITVSDADSANLTGASVSIGGFVAGDTLGFVNQNGISGSYNAGTGVLTLSGSSSVANYQTALRSVTYSSTSDNPTVLGANITRTLGWTVTDGNGVNPTSNAVTSTVTITATDDPPVAVADAASTFETSTVSFAVVTNDTDVDGGPKAVASIAGTAVTAGGAAVTLTSGATVALNLDGTVTYNPNGKFDYLVSTAKALGNAAYLASATDSFTYALNGGSTTTVTVTVNGIDGAGDQLRGTLGNNVITGTAGNDIINISQGGSDTVVTNGGSDGVYVGIGLDSTDRITGSTGAGVDNQVIIQGNYVAVLTGPVLTNIQTLAIQPGNDVRFGDTGTGLYSYSITFADDNNVAAGATLTVNSNRLRVGENLFFNGAAESDGKFIFYAASGNDTLIGGGGDDIFYGRLGADTLTGNGGNDVFHYRAAAESVVGSRDTITDFTTGDKIDVSFFDANTFNGAGTNDAFSFVGSAAFTPGGGGASAGQLRAVNTVGNTWLIEGDTNGDGTADFSLLVTTGDGHTIVATDFVL